MVGSVTEGLVAELIESVLESKPLSPMIAELDAIAADVIEAKVERPVAVTELVGSVVLLCIKVEDAT